MYLKFDYFIQFMCLMLCAKPRPSANHCQKSLQGTERFASEKKNPTIHHKTTEH